MKRLTSSALYGVGGGVIGLGAAMFATGVLHESEASQRASIEACAVSLPLESTYSTELPKPCTRFGFDNTETIQRITVDGVMNKTVTVEFNLPSSDDFSTYANEAVKTDAQQNEINQRLQRGFAIATAMLGVFAGAALPPNAREYSGLATDEE